MATSSPASGLSATRPATAPADSSAHPLAATPAPVLSSLPSQTPAMLQQAHPPGAGHGHGHGQQQPMTGKPTLASHGAPVVTPHGQDQARQLASALPMSRKGAGEPDSDSKEEPQNTHIGKGAQARDSEEGSAEQTDTATSYNNIGFLLFE